MLTALLYPDEIYRVSFAQAMLGSCVPAASACMEVAKDALRLTHGTGRSVLI